MKKKNEEQKQENNDSNIVNSKYHTLIVTDVPEFRHPINDQGAFAIIPPRKNYKLYVGPFGEDERGTHLIIDKLRQSKDENDTLEIAIASYGGYVNELKTYQNVINDMFIGKTITVLDSYGFSAGAMMFLMGDDRVVYPSSEIMFHTYSSVYWGKSGDVSESHNHDEANLKPWFYNMLVDEGYLTKKEFNKMCLGKDFWMSSPEMCKRGIATHVMMYGHKVPAKLYVKYVKGKITFEDLMETLYPQK